MTRAIKSKNFMWGGCGRRDNERALLSEEVRPRGNGCRDEEEHGNDTRVLGVDGAEVLRISERFSGLS